jgi:hypothetical protein
MKEIYLTRNGQQYGPYTLAQLQGLLIADEVSRLDLCWYEGCDAWIPLSQLPIYLPAASSPSAAPAQPEVSVGTNSTSNAIDGSAILLGSLVLVGFGAFLVLGVGYLESLERTIILGGVYALFGLWSIIDSYRFRIASSRKPYSWNNGALSWLLTFIVMSFVCQPIGVLYFPTYLYRRAKVLRERGSSTGPVSLLGGVLTLLIIAQLITMFVYPPVPVDQLSDRVKEGIQEQLSERPETKGMVVQTVSLTHDAGRIYRGTFTVANEEGEETVDITVTCRWSGIEWESP